VPVSTEDVQRHNDLMALADECEGKARDAIERGSSVGAREWFEAAEAAMRAAREALNA
jgi:hypothetical protein